MNLYINSKTHLVVLFAASLLLVSCATSKQVAYFQDSQVGQKQEMVQSGPITVQPQDQLSIVVSSREPQITSMFNLPYISQGISGSSGTSSGQQIMGYTIDSEGNIDFPVLGKISVAGLSREAISAKIKDQLIERKLIKDPVVTVNFLNLQYSVLGEVSHPGQFDIKKDKVTILEALSQAGDLTIYGQRDKVYLTRMDNGSRTTYRVDMRSSDIYKSPAFYLHQNDMIYVEPNKVRANQSTVNGNNVRSVSLWLSIASFLTTLGILIFN